MVLPASAQVGRTPQNPAIIQILNQDDYKNKADKKTLSDSTRKFFKDLGNDLSFNYSAQFSGPSLSPDYQGGAGYNRFKSGRDAFNIRELDPTGSYQVFHALTIGYQLNSKVKLYYGFTFQDDINGNIRFQRNNVDGSTQEFTRSVGVSANDKRLGATFFSIINNDYINFSLSTFYEFASTATSRSNNKHFGLGLSPVLSFKPENKKLNYGFFTEFIRSFYSQNEFRVCDLCFVTRVQTVLINITPYLTYKLGEISTFKSSLNFDWDQRGNQTDNLKEFNNNLDNTLRVGIDYNIAFGINAGYFLEAAINDPDIEKTTLGLNFRFNLY